jgi:ribonuclease HII
MLSNKLQPDPHIEKWLAKFYSSNQVVGFIDEVGYGSCAGDLYTCCVTLANNSFFDSRVNDSKKLDSEQISEIAPVIKSKVFEWSIGIASVAEINKSNVQLANILAMKRAVDQLNTRPDVLFIDGSLAIDILDIKQHSIVKGDSRVFGIACASIVAKFERDSYMKKLHLLEPYYDWEHNVGYHTPKHMKGLAEHGVSSQHRVNYKNVKNFIRCGS